RSVPRSFLRGRDRGGSEGRRHEEAPRRGRESAVAAEPRAGGSCVRRQGCGDDRPVTRGQDFDGRQGHRIRVSAVRLPLARHGTRRARAAAHVPMTSPAQTQRGGIRLRDGLGFSFLVFIALRVALSVVSIVAVGTVKPPAYATDPEVRLTRGWHNAIDATDRWDARWFERIAEDGYDPTDASAAFFPGYPLT